MLMLGDCIDKLKTLRDCSVDAVVTDPPYGLAFMGKKWDYDVPAVEVWAECLRVLKPGGHLLAFAGTRTQHRMAVRIEDAGFEIRDMIAWVYGSGFPKSHDVSKAIDKAAGAERGEEQPHPTNQCKGGQWCKCQTLDATGRYSPTKHPAITAPATDAARQWSGWGTALKPALEPITVARKPLCGTVAENVLKHGTGGINVDGCRVGTDGETTKANIRKGETNGERAGMSLGENISFRCDIATLNAGRWPANLIHSGEPEVVGLFPEAGGGFGVRGKGGKTYASGKGFANTLAVTGQEVGYGDSGSAARFFYCAKASKADREEGCDGFSEASAAQRTGRKPGSAGINAYAGATGPNRNHHPTVKPTALMRYLCRLVTPPGGIVLDPFMGSGSTGKGAILEGFRFIGIERDPDYMQIAESRINHAQRTAMETKDVPHQLELEVASA